MSLRVYNLFVFKVVFRRSVVLLILMLASLNAWGALDPSQQQLQMFNSLSQAEKQQVIQALGASGASFSLPSNRAISSPTTKPDSAQAFSKQPSAELEAELEATRNRFKGGDTLILYIKEQIPDPNKDVPVIEEGHLPSFEDRIYQLDKNASLDLPDVGKISLGGLTEEEAAARIALESMYQGYKISVMRLPLIKTGRDALKPFGYRLFDQDAGALLPPTDIPAPSDYIIGPGDTINIQLFGKENQNYVLQVARDGSLAFPGVGFIPVAGLNFDELKRDIQQRVKRQFIGVESHITLGELRSIRVFVLGEVENPGVYSVGSLSSMSHALVMAGGVKEIGSLRDIQLKRKGGLVASLDVYDLLLKGDTRNDVRLKPGDVVYVPPIGMTVEVYGEVRRPAIYELKKPKSVAEVVEIAGGVLPAAYLEEARLERVKHELQREIIQVNLNKKPSPRVRDGDIIRVDSVTDRLSNVVTVKGQTDRPGWYQWVEGLRVTEIFKSAEVFKPNVDLEYILIKRFSKPDHKLSILTINLIKAWQQPDSDENALLQPHDEIFIFETGENRQRHIAPIVQQLTLQSSQNEPTPLVRVSGKVHAEGSYPLVKSMRISDLIRAAGRLQESAYTLEAELTRYVAENGKPRELKHLRVPLAQVLAENAEADLLLQPFDHLNIKEIPLWEQENFVEIRGEVLFPGKYAIKRGEKLSQLLMRAGGLTQYAYPAGSVFMREELRRREQERMDAMAAKLEAELASLSLQRSGSPAEIASGGGVASDLLSKLRTVKAAGRLVIQLGDISEALKAEQDVDETLDVFLRDGDKLFVPARMQEVTVIGEVFHPTSHLFSEDFEVSQYVNASGGTTNQAAKGDIYVIKADGSVSPAKKNWLSPSVKVSPGDTIVVPFDSDRVSKLKLWTDISRITYQLGLSVAAWNSVGLLTF